jgi:fatty acid synthase subunit beta
MSAAEAQSFQLRHKPEELVVDPKGDQCLVRFKAGCTLFVPKALQMERFVAGQLPTGWDASRYGVPKDIIDQVDPITLYVLVSTVEALVSAGITDPYEFYQYVHLAEVGNTMGSGMGGMIAQRHIYRDRFLDNPTVKSDVLQESFINTMPAWINLLLLSSAGPIKTPVGACATAVESMEIGVDTILSGKAKIVLVGGYDNFTVESSTEFAKMGATSNSAEERAKGREPAEMSRPMAASRGGFMESVGAGTHVIMTAELALRMGCPIYGIVACTHMAMDKEGRSVPAPGQGVLTTARKLTGERPRVLDINYRLRQFERAKDNIQRTYAEELVADPASAADLTLEMERRMANERKLWGSDFASGDTRVAPLEAALAKYGLTADDIGLASFHGTGTAANDTNETQILHKQMIHLGRTPGNMLPAICQKYLTGHPKGAAAAWMLNGYYTPG